MAFEGGELRWRNFSYWRSFQHFAYSSATISLANKRRLPFDSAWSKGAETTFQGVLTVGGDGLEGGEV